VIYGGSFGACNSCVCGVFVILVGDNSPGRRLLRLESVSRTLERVDTDIRDLRWRCFGDDIDLPEA